MANPYNMFKTDPIIETETGVTLDYGDFRVRVGRAGGANKKYSKLLEARMKPHQRILAAGTMDDDVATRILVEVFSETVVLGCDVLDKEKSTVELPVYKDGIINEAGEVVEDNKANRIVMLTNLPELFADVRKQANDFTLFLVVQQEEAIKN
jgi:hypothetical protein